MRSVHQKYFSFFFFFSMLFLAPSVFANQIAIDCRLAYRAVQGESPKFTHNTLDRCKSRCGALTEEYRIENNLEAAYQFCVQQTASGDSSDAKVTCSDAITQLAACKENCKPDYDNCVTTCRAVSGAVERTEAFRRCDANYRGKPITAAGAEPVDPTDEPASTTSDGAVDPTDTVPPAEQNTGETNTQAQLPSLEGLGNTPYGETDLSNDASAIDFSKGPSPDRGGYQQAASGISSAGAQGMAAQGHSNFNGELPTGEVVGGAPSPSGGNSSGGGAGGGAPPMNSSGLAGGGGGGGANGAKRPNSGVGGGRNGAAEYLSRHSPFSFQAAGGSAAPGSNGKRNVANDKTKKPHGPTYVKKENDGKDALNRLFGNGTTPASYRRNPYAGSAACGDTIFCSMEIYHNKIERLPNHDINPDSL